MVLDKNSSKSSNMLDSLERETRLHIYPMCYIFSFTLNQHIILYIESLARMSSGLCVGPFFLGQTSQPTQRWEEHHVANRLLLVLSTVSFADEYTPVDWLTVTEDGGINSSSRCPES